MGWQCVKLINVSFPPKDKFCPRKLWEKYMDYGCVASRQHAGTVVTTTLPNFNPIGIVAPRFLNTFYSIAMFRYIGLEIVSL